MELKMILLLARRWAWLLALGVILGSAGAYLVSRQQQPVYVASTKIMVTQAPRSSAADVQLLNDRDLTETYIELLVTRPVIAETSERLGFGVSASQISARRVGSTGLLEVVVRDTSAERAAAIANEVVQVLIARNESLQSNLFASTEESLQAQIAQVEEQMSALQTSLSQASEQTLEFRQQELTDEMATLDEQIYALQSEISRLEVQIETLTPRASLGEAPPPLSPEQQSQLSALRTDAAQKRFQLGLAQDRYATLAAQLAGGDSFGEAQSGSNQPQTTLALYQQIYSNLLSSYEAVRLARLQNTAHVVQVEAAIPPQRPVQTGPLSMVLLGATVGLIVMGGIAFLVEYLDDTLKTPGDITRSLGLPVIGRILAFPRRKKKTPGEPPFITENSRSVQAEAFRALHTNLEFAGTERRLKTILFTSTLPEEGKSTVVMNLALTMVHAHQKVAIVDADLRRPSLHYQTGTTNHTGVGDFLEGHMVAEEVVLSWPRGRPGLSIVTSGKLPRYPTESLRSQRMDDLLGYLRDIADFVLIDSPPLVVADAAVLASKADGVVLVMQPGRTNSETAHAVIEQLNRVGAHIIGVVLTRVAEKKSQYRDVRDMYHYKPRDVEPVAAGRTGGVWAMVQKFLASL
ncbi:MAG TPA: polysaccharide biosynthesis tyrosine autokinase [Candidatus Binatia bacterium]|nr:polysaccharide biosynthesis tyrosine autokinase [Candidatus Binatia bacterium]